MTSNLQWAMHYARQGWPVMPCHYTVDQKTCAVCHLPIGVDDDQCALKSPMTKHGSLNATTDVVQVTKWWTDWPSANVAIATGKRSGLYVVDLDDKDERGGTANWSELVKANGGFGEPIAARTGSGGYHLYYSLPEALRADDTLTNSAGKLANGVDTRGRNGYVLAAPSGHYSGGSYSWLQSPDKAPGALPAWVSDLAGTFKRIAGAAAVKLEGTHTLTRDDLEAYVEQKRRSQVPNAAQHVAVAQAVLDGTSWGKGKRHSSMLAFLGSLRVWVWDKYKAALDPDSSSLLFEGCCEAATAEGVNTITDPSWIASLMRYGQDSSAEFLGQVEAARKERTMDTDGFMAAVEEAAQENTRLGGRTRDEMEEAIKRAFGTDRTAPYTPEELADMEPIHKRWLFATAAGAFIREPGGDYIGPFQDKLVPTKCRDVLAPAMTADVYLTRENEKTGERMPKSFSELLDQYGQVPSQMAYSYTVARSVLQGNTFTQRAGRCVSFEPEYDEQIAGWLKLFAADQEEGLLDWLATILDLGRPTAAVCIMGVSGAGKDLFADGLTQLWGTRIAFHKALDHFNSELIRSPLVFANEEVRGPQHFKGSVAEALKDMIASDNRKVEAKYAGAVDLHGALRVILATNAKGILKFDRQPTAADIQALDDRILLLRPGLPAREYLINVGGRDTTEEWVRGGRFARHVMWLRSTRKVKPGPRFIVQGRGGMSAVLAADGRGSAAVLRALLNALLGPMQMDKSVAVFDRDGGVWASANALKDTWPMYGGKDDLPEDMQGVFDVVCEPGSSASRKVDGKVVRQRKLLEDVFLRGANSNDRLEEYMEAKRKAVQGWPAIA